MKETHIDGHKVLYEENAWGGMDYLMMHLDAQESKVFFDQARSKGHIKFEDAVNKHYTLSHSNGVYTITRAAY